jgi:hypothetical protein
LWGPSLAFGTASPPPQMQFLFPCRWFIIHMIWRYTCMIPLNFIGLGSLGWITCLDLHSIQNRHSYLGLFSDCKSLACIAALGRCFVISWGSLVLLPIPSSCLFKQASPRFRVRHTKKELFGRDFISSIDTVCGIKRAFTNNSKGVYYRFQGGVHRCRQRWCLLMPSVNSVEVRICPLLIYCLLTVHLMLELFSCKSGISFYRVLASW